MSDGSGSASGVPSSTAEKIAERLRDQIFDGELQQGERLREIPLSESLGVSRRTVREALLMLAEQRLVTHELNRGAVVRELTRADIVDLYRVRRTLELQGSRNAPFAGEPARQALNSAFAGLEHALHNGEARDIARSDLAFHGAVVGLSESPRLDAFYAQVSSEMEMALTIIRGGEQRSGMSTDQIIGEHREIRDLLLGRDVFEAQRAIQAHIDLNERFLLSLTDTEGDDGGAAGDALTGADVAEPR